MLFTSCGDNEHYVYIDGKLARFNDNKDKYTIPISTIVPLNTKLIAVSITNRDGAAGWKGSFYDGSLVTDDSWKCTSNFYSGWYKVDFDDNDWSALYTNGSPIAGCTGFPASAKWMWSEPNYNSLSTTYCRKTLGKFFGHCTFSFFL